MPTGPPDRLRIGIFHGNATDANPGGKAVFVRRIAEGLAAHHDVVLYTGRHDWDGASPIADDVAVVRFDPVESPILRRTIERSLPLPADRLLALAGAVRDRVARHATEHVDVLLTHRVIEDIVISNLVDVPVAYQYHNVESVGPAARARERLTDAELHIANSPTVAREAATELGRRVDGIVTPGVDTDEFSPAAEPAVRTDDEIVLFVGRVIPEKGVFDLLRAIKQLERDPSLYVVGPGQLDRLEARARDLGVDESLTIVGAVPHESLPGYYASATVVCNPTRYDGFGMVNVEAMAAGTPLVTSRLSGVTEYAVHDRNALLVEPGDVPALADTLDALLADRALRERLATAGVRTAGEYSWDAQARRLADFLSTVVET